MLVMSQIISPKNKGITKKWIIIAASSVILLVLSVAIIIAANYFNPNIATKVETSPINPQNNVSQTDSKNLERTQKKTQQKLFEELTIPYLRKRTYVSSLNSLEELNETETYTSYLTSYDSDDFEINGLLTIPKGERPEEGWPGIVFVHGYIPPQQYQTTQNYSAYVDYLAQNEFVVFKIDLRGHGESEGDSRGAYYSSDYIIDTLNAYNALQNSEYVDSDRVGLWGHSMGGNVVFRSFVVKQNIPAVNIWSGAVYTYSDFQDYRIQDDSYEPPPQESKRREYRTNLRQIYGEFDPESEFWKQVVPTNYLDGVEGALQINHAVNDSVVSIEYSRNIVKVLENTSIEHELKEYSSGGHNITGSAFNQAMSNTVSFYEDKLNE